MPAENSKNRGAVAPGKTQTNWRIVTRSFDKVTEIHKEHGFDSVPAMVNYILNKALFDEKVFKAIFNSGGR